MSNKILETANLEHIRGDVYYVPEGTVEIGRYAFNTYKGSIKVNNNGKVDIEIGESPIFGIKKVVLPEGLKIIGERAFWDSLISMTEINIPLSVEKIGSEAFSCLDDFEEVHITANIKKIEAYAFVNTPKLTIYFKGKESDIPKNWHKDWNVGVKVQYE